MKAGAQQVLDSFCGKYCQEKRQLTWHAHHPLGGQMLVEAAFVALPRPSGADVSAYSAMSFSLRDRRLCLHLVISHPSYTGKVATTWITRELCR